jgi:hypothetical protein
MCVHTETKCCFRRMFWIGVHKRNSVIKLVNQLWVAVTLRQALTKSAGCSQVVVRELYSFAMSDCSPSLQADQVCIRRCSSTTALAIGGQKDGTTNLTYPSHSLCDIVCVPLVTTFGLQVCHQVCFALLLSRKLGKIQPLQEKSYIRYYGIISAD